MYYKRNYRFLIPALMGVVALGLVVTGVWAVTYKVYDQAPEDYTDPFLLFEKLNEAGMTIESTYGGVGVTDDGAFYFTYDRTAAAGGAKPCPT